MLCCHDVVPNTLPSKPPERRRFLRMEETATSLIISLWNSGKLTRMGKYIFITERALEKVPEANSVGEKWVPMRISKRLCLEGGRSFTRGCVWQAGEEELPYGCNNMMFVNPGDIPYMLYKHTCYKSSQ